MRVAVRTLPLWVTVVALGCCCGSKQQKKEAGGPSVVVELDEAALEADRWRTSCAAIGVWAEQGWDDSGDWVWRCRLGESESRFGTLDIECCELCGGSMDEGGTKRAQKAQPSPTSAYFCSLHACVEAGMADGFSAEQAHTTCNSMGMVKHTAACETTV
jgi:hypothetical protein